LRQVSEELVRVFRVFRRAAHWTYFGAVRISGVRRAISRAYQDLGRHHTLQTSAALSYYFVLSAFPSLILLSAVLGFIPLPDLFGHVLLLMSRLLPADTMRVVYSVLHDVLSSHRGTWFSFGMIGTVWMGSSAFDAMIEALDIAYDANEDRPYWKTRLLAVGLAAICGALLLVALAVLIVGPRFGDWLAAHLEISSVFVAVWPVLHWTIAIGFTVLAVEVIYFLAPNVKQRFVATLPGAVLSVFVWDLLSCLLGIYFRHFANYNRTYGTLGGFIALMIWLYWTSFVLLVGAELNAELAKESKQGSIEPKSEPREETACRKSVDLDRAA
jgi:membrane protein